MNTDQAGTRNTALVTGAFSGIGLATALKLAQDGWVVYATGRTISKSAALTAQAKTLGVQVKPIVLDVTDENTIQAAIQQIEQESGRLDVLVNNAGGSFIGAVTDSGNRQMRQVFETNVIGMVAVTRLAMPLMLKHHQGRIINMSSALGKAAFPGVGIYAATKYAVEGLSDAMRLEFRILGPDFHVILIEPGFIKTPFAENSGGAERGTQGPSAYGESYINLVEKSVKAGIEGGPGPETVARVIAKAARQPHPKSRYVVTGNAALLVFLRRLLPDSAFDTVLLSLSGLGKYITAQQQTNRR